MCQLILTISFHSLFLIYLIKEKADEGSGKIQFVEAGRKYYGTNFYFAVWRICCCGLPFKDVSVFIPASAQEKGIDLLLYKFCNGVNLINTIQGKMSRTYYDINKKYQGTLRFNRFVSQDNAD